MSETQRVGEVIESSTTDFIAQCYELYELPPLGSLVKTGDSDGELYGIVYNATTSGVEPGRRPIARGKDEASETAIYQSNPQLLKLLRSEFEVAVVGHRREGKLCQYLPPKPARIHGFVYQCLPEEVREFSQSFDFLTILIDRQLSVPTGELISASLRQMGKVRSDDRGRFLVTAGKELAILLSHDFNQLKAILERIKR